LDANTRAYSQQRVWPRVAQEACSVHLSFREMRDSNISLLVASVEPIRTDHRWQCKAECSLSSCWPQIDRSGHGWPRLATAGHGWPLVQTDVRRRSIAHRSWLQVATACRNYLGLAGRCNNRLEMHAHLAHFPSTFSHSGAITQSLSTNRASTLDPRLKRTSNRPGHRDAASAYENGAQSSLLGLMPRATSAAVISAMRSLAARLSVSHASSLMAPGRSEAPLTRTEVAATPTLGEIAPAPPPSSLHAGILDMAHATHGETQKDGVPRLCPTRKSICTARPLTQQLAAVSMERMQTHEVSTHARTRCNFLSTEPYRDGKPIHWS
jgi:hypothetical protein